MKIDESYSRSERFWLWTLGIFGFVGVNGAFLFGVLYQPTALEAALTNPVAAAFIVEAVVLVGVIAYLFQKWGVSQLGWGWFIFLSYLGSMVFAIAIVLLSRGGRRQADADRDNAV